MVRDSPGGGGTHANSVQQRVAIGEATRQGEFLVLQQSRSNYQLPAGLAVAYARSSRRRVGVWQKACAALPTGSRALREFAVPSRDPRQRNSRPPGLARVCATGSGQVGTWQLENILQDRPVVNLHRANERFRLHFYLIVLQSFAAAPMCSAPHKKNSGCLF